MFGLSIILVQFWGVFGVLFATAIARLFVTTMVDPYLLHKYKFKTPAKKYYIKYIYYALILIIDFILCYLVVNRIAFVSFFGIILKGIIIAIISISLFILSNYRTQEYKALKTIIINMILNKVKRSAN